MKMVKAVYHHVGQDFFILFQTPHISATFSKTLITLEIAAQDRVGPQEKAQCVMAFGREQSRSFGELSLELGGQPLGERRIKALHFHHAVSIDLRKGISPSTPVWLRMAGGGFGNA
ncbi:hypothetical protein [Rhizobium laguerreae]|uniref:hypothetical protein n=1 Tax=Rhizobium laguerreae TaxID=1076926 RepID=UPI001C915247|nr:hypothetical protein [Rhizobium laguerreae]MBY3117317.1 hypothetical protein [Rhizobium laguerreae]